MNNIMGLLNNGKLALNANKRALSTTSNNIANVNTPGYTRQRANFEALSTGGVHILNVERLRDQFIDIRLRDSNARLGSRDTVATNLQLLETALNESDDAGVSKSLQDFFGSLQSLTTAPSGSAERFAVRSRAELLIAALDDAALQSNQIRQQVDQQVRHEIDSINSLTSQIAEVNKKLVQSPPGENTLGLQDQRDRLIEQLSTRVPVRVLEGTQGTKTVIMPTGVTLVEHDQAYKLAGQSDVRDDGMARVLVQSPTGGQVVIEHKITEGSLGGLLRVRDQEIPNTVERLDRLSAELVRTFNLQHQQGVGLDGVGGRDFFTGLSVSGGAAFGNSGGATLAAGPITDASLLTMDDYEVRFTDPTTYDIVNVTQGTTISSGNAYVSGATISVDGFEFSISDGGAGGPATNDVFTVNTYKGTAARIDLDAAIKADTGAIAAGLTAAPGDNANALALAALQTTKVLGAGTSQTFEDYHIETRSSLGLGVEVATNDAQNESINNVQLMELANGAHGVSEDEEALSLIQYERAYQAASRIITVTDELLQTTIGMI